MERGDKFAQYELGEFLGAGGTAEVFEARCFETNELVVIKILLPDLPREYAARFLRECEILQALSHPHILRVRTSGKEDERPYYVMDHLSAVTLQRRLDETYRPLPDNDNPAVDSRYLMKVADQTLAALVYAHEQGVYHRDIKPENVLLDEEGTAYLADFGLALLTDATSITAEGQMVGTISHMSPEQVKGQKPDGRSDIYQMGILLHEMFVGHLPFPELSNYQALMRRVQSPISNPIIHHPDLPPSLGALIVRACEPDPTDRFQSILELRNALSQEARTFPLPPPDLQSALDSDGYAVDGEDFLDDVEDYADDEAGADFDEAASAKTYRLVTVIVLLSCALLGGLYWFTRPDLPDYLAQARERRAAADTERAEQLYRLALTTTGTPAVRDELATLLLEAGRTNEAMALYGNAIDFNSPTVLRIWLTKATAHAEQGKWNLLLDVLAPVVSALPRCSEARLLRAEAQLAIGATDKARDELMAIPESERQTATWQWLDGEIRFKEGKPEETLAALERTEPPSESRAYGRIAHLKARIFRTLNRDDDEAAALTLALQRAPSTEGWLRLGDLSAKLTRPNEAIHAYAAAAHREPKNERALPLLYCLAVGNDHHVTSALAALQLRRGGHAFFEALRRYSTIQRVLMTSRGYTSQVAAPLAKLVTEEPLLIPARYLQASLKTRADPRSAALDIVALLDEHPSFSLAYAGLAQTALALKDISGAQKHLERGLAIAPHSANLATLYGQVLIKSRKFEEAFQYLQRFIDDNPHQYHIYTTLGRFHMRYGQLGHAVPIYLNLCKLWPTPVRATLDIGQTSADEQSVLTNLTKQRRQRYARERATAADQLRQLHVPIPPLQKPPARSSVTKSAAATATTLTTGP